LVEVHPRLQYKVEASEPTPAMCLQIKRRLEQQRAEVLRRKQELAREHEKVATLQVACFYSYAVLNPLPTRCRCTYGPSNCRNDAELNKVHRQAEWTQPR
jgi:hypothetical protein